MNGTLQEFTAEINKLRLEQGLSQNALANKSGIGKSTLSRLMSGEQSLTYEFVVKLADALGKDAAYLAEKAGLRTITPPVRRDPTVEYWAQQLDAMPQEIRDDVLDVVSATVDAFNRVAGLKSRRTRIDLTIAALETRERMGALKTIQEKAEFLRNLSKTDKEVFNILHEWNRGKSENIDDVDWDQLGDVGAA